MSGGRQRARLFCFAMQRARQRPAENSRACAVAPRGPARAKPVRRQTGHARGSGGAGDAMRKRQLSANRLARLDRIRSGQARIARRDVARSGAFSSAKIGHAGRPVGIAGQRPSVPGTRPCPARSTGRADFDMGSAAPGPQATDGGLGDGPAPFRTPGQRKPAAAPIGAAAARLSPWTIGPWGRTHALHDSPLQRRTGQSLQPA